MPIYEYKCRNCGEHFEKRQSISEEPLTVCEKCGGGLEKQWSLSGFQFKGAGWYVTDYSAKKPAESKGDKADKTEKTSGGESTDKSETASNKTETPKKSEPSA
jgi:putative FmdB family regulatory protein